jgi:integrase
MSELLLDRASRRRSLATMPGFHAGRTQGNKGLRYPADPPKVEEIIAVMRAAGDCAHGRRLRGLIVLMWRAGLRIQQALALTEGDSIDGVAQSWSGAVRAGAVARSAWTHRDGNSFRPGLTSGASSQSARCCASSTARRADGTRRQLRHAPSCSAPTPRRECGAGSRHTSSGMPAPSRWPTKASPLIVIQRQLGHSNLGITSVYLQGIDSGEIFETVHARRAPVIPVSTSLRL